jgi:hypothetical protein
MRLILDDTVHYTEQRTKKHFFKYDGFPFSPFELEENNSFVCSCWLLAVVQEKYNDETQLFNLIK